MAIMEAIATQYLEADAGYVEFSSIPATYEHLKISVTTRSTQYAVYHAFLLRLGTGGGAADSGGNYTTQYIYGYGGSNAASRESAATGVYISLATAKNRDMSFYGPATATLFDYANANKNTSFYGENTSGALGTPTEYLEFTSGSWDNTGAVDRIRIVPYSSGSIVRGSEFTIYGVKSS